MSKPPYRSLRIGSRIVSTLIAVGGLLMIFADKPLIVRVFLLWMTDIRSIYPAYLVWGRSEVRLAVAALLYFAKPREAHPGPVGGF